MIIKSAEFIKSSASHGQCPPADRPEYAFIGRSNVGKSTLINMLSGTGKLAKSSSTPGKTRLINHFLVNDDWYLVDLPGYGYARVPKTLRREIGKMIYGYISNRANLVCLFVLIDSRHSPLQADMDFIRSMGVQEVPFVIVFTKCDKLSANKLESNLNKYLKVLKQEWERLPSWFCTSAVNGRGRDEILDFIENTNREINFPRT